MTSPKRPIETTSPDDPAEGKAKALIDRLAHGIDACGASGIPDTVDLASCLQVLIRATADSQVTISTEAPASTPHAAPSKAPKDTPNILPLKVGRFELQKVVGTGGFGIVLRALDTELQRTVAIKLPRQIGMTPKEQERFLREARAAAQLRHPGIVSVHEVGRSGDSVYIVRDFVHGVTLDEWLTAHQPTSEKAAELCRKIAVALHHAHEHGVVHRDLKPANVMIDAAGDPHLMDFGLAKRDAADTLITLEGQLLGTPAYMSPEQAKGDATLADRRSDVYSLGVMLYQLLTGSLPFDGNAATILHEVVNDPPPSPRSINATLPRDLETITLKCLEKSPSARYQSANELAADLTRYLTGVPIHARPITRPERVLRWARRNPLVAALSLTVFTLLFGSTILSSLLSIEARHQARIAIASQRESEKARNTAIQEQTRAMSSLYYAQMMAVPRQIEQLRFDKARQILRETPPQFRHWEWGYFARLCNLDLGTFPERDEVMAAAFSPDGSTFAAAGKSGLCTVYDWPRCTVRHLLRTSGAEVTSLAYSPNSRLLVTGQKHLAPNGAGITVWDVTSGTELMSLRGHDGGVKCVGFSCDGGLIASGGYDGAARIWNSHSGEPLRILKQHSTVLKSLAFSPTHGLIATADMAGDNTVRVWNPSTGEIVWQLPTDTEQIDSLLFSPDGATLAVGLASGTVDLWNVDSRSRVDRLRLGWHAWALAFSPDGKTVACGQRGPEVYIYSLIQKQLSQTLRGHGLYVNAVSFSKDGKVLLTGSSDGTIKLWPVDLTTEITELRGIPGPFVRATNVKFIPGGKRVAVATSSDKYLRIWDSQTGLEAICLGPHATDVRSFDVSLDGRNLVAAADRGPMLWDLDKGTSRLLSLGDSGKVNSVAFSSDGKLIAAACGPIVTLWDIQSNRIAKTIHESDSIIRHVCCLPYTKLIATVTFDPPTRLCVWNIDTLNSPLYSRTFSQVVYDVSASPDGKRLVIAAGHSPTVLDANSGQELYKLNGHDDIVTSIAFSPDGKRIVTTTITGAVSIWDASDGRELLTLDKAGGRINSANPWPDREFYCADFSPDGNSVAVGGNLGEHSGVLLLAAYPHNGTVLDRGNLYSDISFAAIKRKALEQLLNTDTDSSDSFTPPWTVKYFAFADADHDGLPDDWSQLVQTRPVYEEPADAIDFSWGSRSPSPQVPSDNFAAVATAAIDLADGIYQIETLSDDGIRVWLDDQLLIANWNPHPKWRNAATISLDKGTHAFKIEYFDTGVDATLKFSIHRLATVSQASQGAQDFHRASGE